MDEQDFNEWGGPKTVRSEYQQETASTAVATSSSIFLPTTTTTSQKALLDAMVVIKPPMNIGRQLLRVLGWRDGSNTAYVPSQPETTTTIKGTTNNNNNTENVDQNLSIVLSQKKLRKIQLQQKRVRIPAAKNNTCGLGFVPYEDAPEFRVARERRQRQARERALAAVQGGSGRNVYKVSNLLTAHSGDPLPASSKDDPSNDPYNDYETTEDFVGSKSVGGFALREDDDDVYDNNMLPEQDNPSLDHDQYDTVVYEHESDPEDDLSRPNSNPSIKRATQDLSGLLSSWATGKKDDVKAGKAIGKPADNATISTMVGLTADGHAHLAGFVLGTSSLPTQKVQRYPGPSVPADYKVQRHVFASEHMPSTLEVLSRAVQLEMVGERQRAALHDALEVNAAANAPGRQAQRDREKPMAGPTFSALAVAMKNRFRSSETQVGSEKSRDEMEEKEELAVDSKEGIKITRTVMTFVPTTLLCKRLHVPMPKGVGAGVESSERVSEATYFQSQILDTAQSAHAKSKDNQKSDKTRDLQTKEFVQLGTDDATDVEVDQKERPPMEVYQAIYEPDLETSSESEENEVSVKEGEEMTAEDESRPSADLLDEPRLGSADENNLYIGEAGQSEIRRLKPKVKDSNKALIDPGAREETSLIPYKALDEERARKRDRKETRRRLRSEEGSADLSSEEGENRRKRHRKDRKRERRRHDERKERRKKESKSDRKRERKA